MHSILNAILGNQLSPVDKEFLSNLLQVSSGLTATCRRILIADGHLESDPGLTTISDILRISKLTNKNYFAPLLSSHYTLIDPPVSSFTFKECNALCLAIILERIAIRDVISYAELLIGRIIESWVEAYGSNMEMVGGFVEELEDLRTFRAVRINKEHCHSILSSSVDGTIDRHPSKITNQLNLSFGSAPVFVTSTNEVDLRAISKELNREMGTFYSELLFPKVGKVLSIEHSSTSHFLIHFELARIINFLFQDPRDAAVSHESSDLLARA